MIHRVLSQTDALWREKHVWKSSSVNFHSKVIKCSDFPECGGGKLWMALQSSCAAGLATKKKEDKDSSLRGFFPTSAAWQTWDLSLFFNRSHSEICLLKQCPPGASLCSTAACSEMGMAVGSARAHAFLCGVLGQILLWFCFCSPLPQKNPPTPPWNDLSDCLGTGDRTQLYPGVVPAII